MKDLTSTRWIKAKGILFLLLGLLSVTLLLFEHPTLKTGLLIIIAVWSFCRFYYFAFYVIEHYVNPATGFLGFCRLLSICFRKNDQTRSAGTWKESCGIQPLANSPRRGDHDLPIGPRGALHDAFSHQFLINQESNFRFADIVFNEKRSFPQVFAEAPLLHSYPVAKPYKVAGFSTRMRWRVASLGAHWVSKSKRMASSGVVGSLGCGQLLPHSIRSGAAWT
jgi:hypothetical protein